MSSCRSLLWVTSRVLSRPHHTFRSAFILQQRQLHRTHIIYNLVVKDSVPSSSLSIDHYVNKILSTTQPQAIHIYYTELASRLKEYAKLDGVPEERYLDETQIHQILFLLAKSGRPSDMQRVNEILLDMPLLFGLKPTVETHTTIIRGLIENGNLQTLRRWFHNMPQRPEHILPTLEQYHIFLEACPEIEECTWRFIRRVVELMKETGCNPTNETFKFVFRARWKLAIREGTYPRPHMLARVLEQMEQEELPYDPAIAEMLYEEYATRNYPIYAEEIQTIYQTKFQGNQPEKSLKVQRDLKLAEYAQSKGMTSALNYFKSWRTGKPPSPAHIQTILRRSRDLSDLQIIEQEFGVKCDIGHWSLLIANNARAGRLDEAIAIYEASKHAGIVPDGLMVSPIIHALCKPSLGIDQEANMDRAFAIYRDLRESVQTEQNPSSRPRLYSEFSSGPDPDIYAALLRGLSRTKLTSKYIAATQEIMNDMAARNYKPTDSVTVSALVILNMRHCGSVAEALEVYRKMKSFLDQKGYLLVLNAFCKLSFGDRVQIPSLQGYFEIVKDLRLAGYDITMEVYTILLQQLGTVATQLRQHGGPDAVAMREELILTTRRAHDLLTIDASLSPDSIVWNRLMDTYQRLGCFADAYRVWDVMYLTGRFDEVSVSTIFDACGYAGAFTIAKQVITRLRRDRYRFTMHNWKTLLESFCRLGRIDEAVRFLCLEMGKGFYEGTKPDVECVRIVLKFARDAGKVEEVVSRIKKFAPELWTSLPADVREW